MGNNNVYSEGQFITPNRIKKPSLTLDENALDIQNVFGKINILTNRAQKADTSVAQDGENSVVTYIYHYEK